MKKVLFLLLASFLVLGACGNKEESKSEDKKETKSSKKDDKKSNDDKSKSDKKKNEKVADNKNVNTNEQPSTQENVQTQQQAPVQQEEVPSTSKAYGLDYNFPQENKASNPTGELSEQDAQRMADQASEYDAEVAEHNANVDANQ